MPRTKTDKPRKTDWAVLLAAIFSTLGLPTGKTGTLLKASRTYIAGLLGLSIAATCEDLVRCWVSQNLPDLDPTLLALAQKHINKGILLHDLEYTIQNTWIRLQDHLAGDPIPDNPESDVPTEATDSPVEPLPTNEVPQYSRGGFETYVQWISGDWDSGNSHVKITRTYPDGREQILEGTYGEVLDQGLHDIELDAILRLGMQRSPSAQEYLRNQKSTKTKAPRRSGAKGFGK